MSKRYLMLTPDTAEETLKALASPVRLGIYRLLHDQGAMNVNDIAARLGLPQSTTSAHVAQMEAAGLISTEAQKARKGNQKLCRAAYDEVVLTFDAAEALEEDAIEVAMPVGLYSAAEVSAPCGMCSTEGIIGYLDSPDTFLMPDRMRASLLWFTMGYVEYQFPNNARLAGRVPREMELVAELSSEVPGTSENWPSDIALSVNGREVAVWTAPGDYGDRRGTLTPGWWKLAGSQYGHLKQFRINGDGTYIDGVRVSPVTLAELELEAHRSIRVRLTVAEDAPNPGGMNIFGRRFGNYDQDIVLRLKV